MDVASAQAVSVQRDAVGSNTVATLVLSPANDAWISWKPRSRDVKREKAVFYAEVHQLYVPSPGVIEGAHYAARWVTSHRSTVLKPRRNAPILLQNLNVPTCATGSVRAEVTVPLAATATDAVSPPDCTSTATHPADDITAFREGYAVLSRLTTTS